MNQRNRRLVSSGLTPTCRRGSFLKTTGALLGIAPHQRDYDMELASRCLPLRCGPVAGAELASRWSSLYYLLVHPRNAFVRPRTHLPRFTFSSPATTSKALSRQPPFSGEPYARLSVQAEAQDPFPGIWVLNHRPLAQLLVLGVRYMILESIAIPFDQFSVF